MSTTTADTLTRFTEQLPEELRLLNPHQELAAAAVWLREYLENHRLDSAVLGLSGGLDSATVALIAARGLRTSQLYFVAMPYGLDEHGNPAGDVILDRSTRESVEHAKLVADCVPGVNFEVVDIAPAVDALLRGMKIDEALRSGTATGGLRLAAANLKARIRGDILRSRANEFNGLVLGTENRTENLLGYFTIGGDEESDVEILSAFHKSQVRQLYIALDGPREILEKRPSADLWAGQTDEAELGFSYEAADFVLYYLASDSDLVGQIERAIRIGSAAYPRRAVIPVDSDTITRVLHQVRKTSFKRALKPMFPPVNRTHS